MGGGGLGAVPPGGWGPWGGAGPEGGCWLGGAPDRPAHSLLCPLHCATRTTATHHMRAGVH